MICLSNSTYVETDKLHIRAEKVGPHTKNQWSNALFLKGETQLVAISNATLHCPTLDPQIIIVHNEKKRVMNDVFQL